MSKLEPWQRYRKATPCPVCGGYGAYKEENRCKGFLTADGKGAYCSQVADSASPKWFESIGLLLYFHPFVGRERGSSRISRMRLRGLQRKSQRLKPPHPAEFG